MKLRTAVAATAALALTSVLGAAALRSTAPQMGDLATEHHALLKRFVGEWTFELEMPDMGMGKMVLTGEETQVMVGDLWVRSVVKSEVMGMPFEGSGVMGYDPGKKQFVGYWFDSFNATCDVTHGEWHEDEAQLVMKSVEKPDMMGKAGVQTAVISFPDDDTMTIVNTWTYGDGSEKPGMAFTYERKP